MATFTTADLEEPRRRKPKSLAEMIELSREHPCPGCGGRRVPCETCEGTRVHPDHWPLR